MKFLNGYVYWPDIIQIVILFWIALIATVLVFKPKPPKEDEEVIRQQILDNLDKVLNKIKSIIKN